MLLSLFWQGRDAGLGLNLMNDAPQEREIISGTMRGNTTMNMTAQRFEQIVTAYGSESMRWPVTEREAALHYMAHTPTAQSLVEEYRELNRLLDAVQVPALTQMERRVLRSLQQITRDSVLDRVLDWLLPRQGQGMAWAWRPALVACLPLICGIYMANFYSFGIDSFAVDTAENSWQEELYLISMNDYAEFPE